MAFTPSRMRPMRQDFRSRKREIPVCGFKAVSAVFARNPACVLRLFYLESSVGQAGPFCRDMAKARKPYRMVPEDDLERISGTWHHGGLVAVTARPELDRVQPTDLEHWAAEGRPVLLLNRVSNHHNLGAIVRSAAFFGIEQIVLAEHRDQALPGEATYRVAEGGMEFVNLTLARDPATVLRAAQSHFTTVATVVRGKSEPPEAVPVLRRRPWFIVLGNEETGLPREITRACEYPVSIPGSGQIESLNVSATAAVLMAWASREEPGS
jgi:TrmH RNA methyltransferase